MSEESELEENERYCFKCKKIVNKLDYNGYYHICCDCVDGAGHK